MEKLYTRLSLQAAKIESRHVQLALVILTLVLFVLGSGAPTDSGGSVPGG